MTLGRRRDRRAGSNEEKAGSRPGARIHLADQAEAVAGLAAADRHRELRPPRLSRRVQNSYPHPHAARTRPARQRGVASPRPPGCGRERPPLPAVEPPFALASSLPWRLGQRDAHSREATLVSVGLVRVTPSPQGLRAQGLPSAMRAAARHNPIAAADPGTPSPGCISGGGPLSSGLCPAGSPHRTASALWSGHLPWRAGFARWSLSWVVASRQTRSTVTRSHERPRAGLKPAPRGPHTEV